MKTKLFKMIMMTAVAVVITTGAFAQNGRFSVGAEVALPMGDFGDNSGTGFGGSLRYEMPVGDNSGLTLTAGYLTFGGKTVSTGFGDYKYTNSMIPVQVGAKYYFTEQQEGFYGMVEIGIHSFTSKFESPAYTVFGVTVPATEVSATSTNLSYAPELGYHLANIDIAARYQMISTEGSSTSYVGIRLAYVFGEK